MLDIFYDAVWCSDNLWLTVAQSRFFFQQTSKTKVSTVGY